MSAFYEDETSSNLKGSVIQVNEDSVTLSVNTKLVSSRHPSDTDSAFMSKTSGANAVNAVFYTSGTTLYTMGSIISGSMDGATLTLGSEFSVQTSTPTTPRCIATNNTNGRTFVFYIRSADVMCRGISWAALQHLTLEEVSKLLLLIVRIHFQLLTTEVIKFLSL